VSESFQSPTGSLRKDLITKEMMGYSTTSSVFTSITASVLLLDDLLNMMVIVKKVTT